MAAQFLKRTLGGSLVSALDALQSLGGVSPEQAQQAANEISQRYGQKPTNFGEPHRRSDEVLRLLGSTREQLAPQGTLETFLQRLGSQAPLAAITGGIGGGLGGAAGALGRAALGAGAATGAGALGAPEWLQDLAQVGTELGTSFHSGKIPTLNKHKKGLYEKARAELKPGERASSKAFKPVLEALDTFNQVETNPRIRKEVNDTFGTIAQNIYRPTGEIDVLNAWESKKSLNRQIRDPHTPKDAKPVLKQMAKGLNDVLEDYKPHNPSFWKSRTDADKIETVQNMSSVISDFADNYLSSKGKLLPKLFLPLKATLKALGTGERALQYVANPSVRAYLGKVFEEVVKNNKSDVLRYASKLGSAVDKAKISEKSPEIVEGWEEISPTADNFSTEGEASGWEEIA